MPATSRYPGESDEQFKARMMQTRPGAFGINVPPLPGAGATPPAPGGSAMMGPSPIGPPNPMDQGPMPDPMQQAMGQGPPKPPPQTGMSEDMLNNLLTTPQDQAALEGLMEERERAHSMRDTAMPEGRQAGRTFVAANPLEFLGAGIKQYRGAKESKRLQGEIGTTRGKIGKKQGEFAGEAAKQSGLEVLIDRFRRNRDKDED